MVTLPFSSLCCCGHAILVTEKICLLRLHRNNIEASALTSWSSIRIQPSSAFQIWIDLLLEKHAGLPDCDHSHWQPWLILDYWMPVINLKACRKLAIGQCGQSLLAQHNLFEKVRKSRVLQEESHQTTPLGHHGCHHPCPTQGTFISTSPEVASQQHSEMVIRGIHR